MCISLEKENQEVSKRMKIKIKEVHYSVMEETLTCEESVHRVYGIRCCAQEIHDISSSREVVEEMADLFNRLQLDPSRARNAVESMLP